MFVTCRKALERGLLEHFLLYENGSSTLNEMIFIFCGPGEDSIIDDLTIASTSNVACVPVLFSSDDSQRKGLFCQRIQFC